MNNTVGNERNSQIDAMRGIAIIMMVYGHTFGTFREWVYLFHMPVLFMISGFLFDEKHITSKENAYKYWFGKLRRLIVPYMICNLIVMLLNNIWVSIGFLNNSEEFLNATANAVNPQRGFGKFGIYTAIVNVYKILLLRYIPQLASPTWFLTVLFGVISVNCLATFWMARISGKKIRVYLFSTVFLLMLLLSWYITLNMPEISNTFELRHLRIIPAYVAFMMGVAVSAVHKRTHSHTVYMILGIVGLVILFIILSHGGHIELSRCEIYNPIVYVLCSLSGWFILFYCSYLLNKIKAGTILTYIGKHTMAILFLHMICFRTVSFIYVLYKGLPKYMIASSPVIFSTSELTKIIYTIVGVVVPIAMYQIWRLIQNKVKGAVKGISLQ